MLKKKILHISGSQFADYVIDQFEKAYPGRNDYFIYENRFKLKHLNLVMNESKKSELILNNYKGFKKYDAIMIHSLTNTAIDIVLRAPKKLNYVWFAFGGDFYSLPKFINSLYTEETKKIIREYLNSNKKALFLSNMYFDFFYNLFIKKRIPRNIKKIIAIKRMKYCAPVIKEDYELLKTNYNIKAKYLSFSYGSIETLVTDFDNYFNVINNNILLGNSAYPNNNHIDILKLLISENNIDKVICPLSYGEEWYKKVVISEGKKILKGKFKPLTSFIELSEYNKILKNCGIVIMNHQRQQAMGNIIASLWYGAKVFLNNKNPAYKYFIRNGIKIFSIQDDLEKELRNNFNALSEKYVMHNRKILEKLYSYDVTIEKTKKLISTVLENK